jgi:chromosome segregation ATPase
LTEENQELDRLLSKIKQDLQESAIEMEKSREEIRKLKLLIRHNDDHNEEYKKENDILKSQIELLKEQIINHHNQDNVIMSTVDERVKEFKLVISAKEDEIKKLRDLVIQMKDSITKAQVDSDKASVSALTKALQEKDKQIDILKKQIDEYAKEMDKSAALINNLNQTFYESNSFFV